MKRTQPEIIKALPLNMNSFPSMIESSLFIEGFAKPCIVPQMRDDVAISRVGRLPHFAHFIRSIRNDTGFCKANLYFISKVSRWVRLQLLVSKLEPA